MGANATQGMALLIFLLAFTCLSLSLFSGGSVIFLGLFVVGLVGCSAMFLKAKPWEHAER